MTPAQENYVNIVSQAYRQIHQAVADIGGFATVDVLAPTERQNESGVRPTFRRSSIIVYLKFGYPKGDTLFCAESFVEVSAEGKERLICEGTQEKTI